PRPSDPVRSGARSDPPCLSPILTTPLTPNPLSRKQARGSQRGRGSVRAEQAAKLTYVRDRFKLLDALPKLLAPLRRQHPRRVGAVLPQPLVATQRVPPVAFRERLPRGVLAAVDQSHGDRVVGHVKVVRDGWVDPGPNPAQQLLDRRR